MDPAYLELTARAFNATNPDCALFLAEGIRQVNERIKRTLFQCNFPALFGGSPNVSYVGGSADPQNPLKPCPVDMSPFK